MPVLPISAAAGEPVVEGPCARWMTWDEVLECRGDDLSTITDEDQQNHLMDMATDLLYWMTGERYSGLCQTTTLICQRSCVCPAEPCQCLPLSFIDLRSYAPVDSVIEIIIDSETVDESEYELRNNTVIRTDGSAWPTTSNLTDPNAFQITFTYGRSPGPFGRTAAAAFAAELALACIGAQCGIRANVRSVSREGTNFVVFDSREMIDQGYTGVTLTDTWLASERARHKYVRPAMSDPLECQTLIPY